MAAKDAEYRHATARIGAARRWHGPTEVQAAQRDLRALRLQKTIAAAVAAIPPLTQEQRDHLAALLAPRLGHTGGGAA